MAHHADRDHLADIAERVAMALRERRWGTRIRPYKPSQRQASHADTDGWVVSLGRLEGSRCELQVWLDTYPGWPKRSLWYGFESSNEGAIRRLAKLCRKEFGEHRTLYDDDAAFDEQNHAILAKRLGSSQFGKPALELYRGEHCHYYGKYERPRALNSATDRARAAEIIAAFLESASRLFSHAKVLEADAEVYPEVENRKVVVEHLQRERKRHLAAERKERDDYRCQVCHKSFDEVYGHRGIGIADAHHRVPLGQLKKKSKTSIEDLITVCPNCHRMLHRLGGKPGDIALLRRVVAAQKHRQRAQ